MSQGRSRTITLGRIAKGSRVVLVGLLLPLVAVVTMLPIVRAANEPSFTFTAAGDYGGITTGSNGQKVANGIANSNPVPNFHIALGDLGYGDQSPMHWCTSFRSIYPASGAGRLVLVTGNHDTWNGGAVNYTDGNSGVANDALTSDNPVPHSFLDGSFGYVSACGAPSGMNWIGSNVTYGGGTCNPSWALASPSCYAREYYFDYPTSSPIMRFIFISAGIGGSWVDYSNSTSGGTAHYKWLKARIDDAKNAGLWVAVVTHKNCISDDSDLPDCASTFDPFKLAVTEKLGVDLWLDGHSHTYERSNQLSNVPNACTKYNNNTVSCQVAHSGNSYIKGQGTVVNIIGTGGEGNDPICTGSCPRAVQFASLCGSNGDVSFPQTSGCNNDYGFSQFKVNTNNITATYVSDTGTFTDSYVIKVPNPPGDFSVSSGPMFVSRNVTGGPATYSSSGVTISRTAYINSFGGFGGTSGFNVSLTSSVKGPTNVCQGPNCPRVTLSPTSVKVFSGGSPSTTLTFSTSALNAPCGNPTQTSQIVYNITITATYGSTQHSLVFPLYIYGEADVDKSGVNNIVDLVLVANRFGNTPPNNWDPNTDFNNDNKIDIVDLATIGSQFGNTSSKGGGSMC